MRDTTTQHRATLRKPSRALICLSLGGSRKEVRLKSVDMTMVAAVPITAPVSPLKKEISRLGSRQTASTLRI